MSACNTYQVIEVYLLQPLTLSRRLLNHQYCPYTFNIVSTISSIWFVYFQKLLCFMESFLYYLDASRISNLNHTIISSFHRILLFERMRTNIESAIRVRVGIWFFHFSIDIDIFLDFKCPAEFRNCNKDGIRCEMFTWTNSSTPAE